MKYFRLKWFNERTFLGGEGPQAKPRDLLGGLMGHIVHSQKGSNYDISSQDVNGKLQKKYLSKKRNQRRTLEKAF